MAVKEKLDEHLYSIWDLIKTMAEDHRIRSDDLDAFNQAFRLLKDQIDLLMKAVKSMEHDAKRVCRIEREYNENKYKMEVCLEICGMTKKGIKHLMDFPTCFLELVLTLRHESGNPILNERDLFWLDIKWDELNLYIENDIESFSQAKFLKQTYFQVNDLKVKEQLKKTMEWYKVNLAYLKSKLGREVDEQELINLITNHYYEILRHCTAEEIKWINQNR